MSGLEVALSDQSKPRALTPAAGGDDNGKTENRLEKLFPSPAHTREISRKNPCFYPCEARRWETAV
jgi:hypothetical protein